MRSGCSDAARMERLCGKAGKFSAKSVGILRHWIQGFATGGKNGGIDTMIVGTRAPRSSPGDGYGKRPFERIARACGK